MSFTRWLRNLQAVFHLRNASGNARRPGRSARPRFRPRLEVLEGRLAPAVLTVNTAADETAADNTLSLREAIGVVNSQSEAGLSSAEQAQISGTLGSNDTIQFAPSLNGQTITLNGAELLISKDLSIVGPGAGALTVSGNHASTVFDIQVGTTVSLSGLTIANGQAVFGGGIINFSDLTVSNCTLSGNTAQADGGGIYNQATGTLIVTDCTLVVNTAPGRDGGGIENVGTMTVSGSTLSGNYAGGGGGIGTFDSVTTVTNCTFADNSASVGGGIASGFSKLTVTSSTFDHNSGGYRGGAIDIEDSTLSATNCTFSGNSAIGGGGILDLASTLSATNCTFSGNSANNNGGLSYGGGGLFYGGGGLLNMGTATLANCTVRGNSTDGPTSAGGIDTSPQNFDASTTLVNCTVADNTNQVLGGTGGLFAGHYGACHSTVTLGNTIVVDNSGNQFGIAGAADAAGGPDVFISQGYNLSSDASGSLSQPGDLQNTEPLLGPLQDNGGPLAGAPGSQQVVPTMALLPGSPAINAGSKALAVDPSANPLTTDQRGFPRIVGGTVDIGAFERQAPVLTVPGAQTVSQDVALAVPGIHVADVDSTTLTVTLAVDHGTLTLASTAGLTATGNGTAAVTLSGSISDLNAALAGLVYQGNVHYSGSDTLGITATGGSFSTQASVAITVRSAAQEAADLQAQVNALYAAGVLNRGQANALTVKLRPQGNGGDGGRVQSFLNQVEAWLAAGILTAAQADPLLAAGQTLLAGLAAH
jgi:hypothetical protein